MPRPVPKRRQDETRPGGCTIRGGYADPETGKHYGGVLQDSEGRVLDQFDDEEENPGFPRPRAKKEGEYTPEEARRAVQDAERERDELLKQQADAQAERAKIQAERDELAARLKDAQAAGYDPDRLRKEEEAMKRLSGDGESPSFSPGAAPAPAEPAQAAAPAAKPEAAKPKK
jgi:hypothetical protein